jgi:cytochrome b561
MLIEKARSQFSALLRILHWLMAGLLLAMLFIGVSMVSSLGSYHMLLSIHRPLGIVILLLAGVRLGTRMFTAAPAFPPTMSRRERSVAKASEMLMYSLFITLPLIGWGMLSAGHYPIVMFGAVNLPPILPARPELYSTLRETHTIFAYLLFLAFLAHLGAMLFHTLILRDGLLNRMIPWAVRRQKGKGRD